MSTHIVVIVVVSDRPLKRYHVRKLLSNGIFLQCLAAVCNLSLMLKRVVKVEHNEG